LKSLLKDPENTQEMVNLWLLFEKISIEVDGSLGLARRLCSTALLRPWRVIVDKRLLCSVDLYEHDELGKM
jgi:hypothetical protein